MSILSSLTSLIPGVGTIGKFGLGALGGALSNTEAARTSTSTPTITPGYQSLADLLKARAMARLNMGTDMGGFKAAGVNNINGAFDNVGVGQNANLEARGLANSPVAGAVVGKANTARAGDIATFLNSIPLLQRQLQDQDIATATNQVGQFGRGTTTVGAGSPLGGAITSGTQLAAYNPMSAAEQLAYLRGKGVLQ